MSEEEKKPYLDSNLADKKRFEDETNSIATKGYFLLPDGQKSSDVRAVQKGDPKPKRITSAYSFFIGENMAKTMSEDKILIGEAMKKISKLWHAMSEEEKHPYFEKNAKDKLRHIEQLEEIKINGYFTVNGKKICEIKKKAKRAKLGKRQPKGTGSIETAKKATKLSKNEAEVTTLEKV